MFLRFHTIHTIHASDLNGAISVTFTSYLKEWASASDFFLSLNYGEKGENIVKFRTPL
jgi:hypothetical protein